VIARDLGMRQVEVQESSQYSILAGLCIAVVLLRDPLGTLTLG